VLRLIQRGGEPVRGTERRRRQVPVGEKGDDPTVVRHERGVPPPARDGLDQSPGIDVASGGAHDRVHGHQSVEPVPARAHPSRHRRPPPRRVHDRAAARLDRASAPVRGTARARGAATPEPHLPGRRPLASQILEREALAHLRSRLTGRIPQQRIEPSPVDVPALAIRVEDEVHPAWLTTSPRRARSVRRQVPIALEPLEHAQVAQQGTHARRQRLPDLEAARPGLGQEDAAPCSCQHQRRRRARWAATGDDRVESRDHRPQLAAAATEARDVRVETGGQLLLCVGVRVDRARERGVPHRGVARLGHVQRVQVPVAVHLALERHLRFHKQRGRELAVVRSRKRLDDSELSESRAPFG
jgi:hypothetical protein